MAVFNAGSAVSRVMLLLSGAATGVSAAAPPDIYVAYPPANHTVGFDHVLFEGSVPAGASLKIDGRTVDTSPDGLFIEWLPLRPGLNRLLLESALGAERSVREYPLFSAPRQALPPRPTIIVPGSVTPSADLKWYGLPGSLLAQSVTVSFHGSPGGRASFEVGQLGPFAMLERTAENVSAGSVAAGLYEGSFVLPPGMTLSGAAVTVTLVGQDQERVSARSAGKVSVGGMPRTAVVTASDIGLGVNAGTNVARNGAGRNYVVFLKEGMKFTVVGEEGNTFRALLTPNQSVNLLKTQVRLLPEGAPLPRVSFSRIETRSVRSGEADFTQLRLLLPDRVPFTVEQSAAGGDQHLDLRLFHTESDVDSIVSAFPDELVRGVRWIQEQDGVTRIRVDLNGAQQWGHAAFYEGATLILQMRRPPVISVRRPLEGRRVLIDPGHGGTESGGAGALRVNEKDLVLPLALRLAEKLRALGASVSLTRASDITVPLYQRPLQAEQERAEVLLSIHANALPDGADPRQFRGAGVYYYWPQARPLAGALLASLLQRVPELGNDGLHHRNLALTRPSSQLSVLVETAFLTDKGNLRLLMSAAGQERLADALARGLEDFYRAQTSTRRQGPPT